MPDVHASYIGSNDYWGYDSDTFNEPRQFFGSAWVVPASEVDEELISEDNLNRCALYYEVGKTDSHLFTPTSIEYNPDADFVLVTGEQGAIGEPGRTVTRRRAYGVGNKAMRYKSMTDGANSRGVGRFMVDYIVISEDSDVENIKSFIDDLEGVEESVEASAEEFSAENLKRINPVAIEGAEDVHGAETLNSSDVQLHAMEEDSANQDFMEEWLNAEGRAVGQNYDGYEVGQEQAAEDANQDFMEDWQAEGLNNDIFHIVLHAEQGALEVHTNDGSTFLADIESGAILHDNADFAAEDSEPLNAEDITFLISHSSEGEGVYSFKAHDGGADHDATSHDVGEDPMAYEPEVMTHDAHDITESLGPVESSPMHGVPEDYGQGMEVAEESHAENIIEAVQSTTEQIPLVRRFELGGWAASALVLGVAGLSGWWIARN